VNVTHTTALLHEFNSRQRLDRSDENRADVRTIRREVQAVIHPVDEVDVDITERLVHDRRAFRATMSVRCRIIGIGFDLNDSAGHSVDVQNRADESRSHIKRLRGEEVGRDRARQ